MIDSERERREEWQGREGEGEKEGERETEIQSNIYIGKSLVCSATHVFEKINLAQHD